MRAQTPSAPHQDPYCPSCGSPLLSTVDGADHDHLAERLRVSESRFRAAFTDAGIGMALIDPDDLIIEANPALATLLGRSVPELKRTHIHELLDPEEAPRRVYRELVRGARDRVRVEKELKHRAGHAVWTNITISLIRDSAGQPQYTLAMVEDVSEARRLGARLHYEATHDPLTHLPNRSLFSDRLAGVFGGAGRGGQKEGQSAAIPRKGGGERRVGLCHLDLEGFQAVNESLGHHVGDQLLVAVAQRLSGRFAPRGHLVARMGGDEFALLVTESAGPDELTALAAEVLELLEQEYELAGQQVTASACVGVVERRVDGTTPADLLKDAAATLHWAKQGRHEGRARWALFDSDRHADQLTRQVLATTMRPALERGEFVVEYQPLVRLSDGVPLGAESLVRWHHPRFGVLAPDRFIGIAEETGAIVPLGMWVLEESCRQGRLWQRAFPEADLFVSVNLAARQIWDSDVVADVADVLERTGLPARLLQLELTESAVLGPAGRPIEALHALAAMGVRIAIDDFGTGYSNLAYLSRLPVHALKLDAAFVAGFSNSGRAPEGVPQRENVDAEIVSALVRLAHVLGLTVTAEGVEGAGQAERLRATGCDLAQGWHFARPGPPDSVTALVLHRQKEQRQQEQGQQAPSSVQTPAAPPGVSP